MALTLRELIESFEAGNIIDKAGDNQDAAAIVAQWRDNPDISLDTRMGEEWASIFTDPWGSSESNAGGGTQSGTGGGYNQTPPGATSPFPVSSTGFDFSAGLTPGSLSDPGSSPVATGFPMFKESFEMMLAADEGRRAAIDQEIRFQTMFAQLLGDDPAVAADLAVRFGLPDMEPDLQYLNRFSKGAQATFGGQVGTQEVSLPWSFSRNQLRFLDANPTVQKAVQSVAERFRRPDVLQTSQMGQIPNSGVTSMFGFSG